MSNRYDKMSEYISSVFNVFRMINKKAEKQRDKRLQMISLVVYNYVRQLANEHKVNLVNVVETHELNLIPIFEYISTNNIELYDLLKIGIHDIDVNKREDIERFVISHIYYITQGK